MKLSRLLVAVLTTVMLFVTLNPVSAQGTSRQQPNLGVIVLPFSLSPSGGVRVLGVKPDSPAAKAGIRPFDVIKAVNGHAVNAHNFEAELAKVASGDTITLSVLRNHTTVDLQAVLADKPAPKMSLQLSSDQALRNLLQGTPLSRLMHQNSQSALQSRMQSFMAPNNSQQPPSKLQWPFRLPLPNLSKITAKPIL